MTPLVRSRVKKNGALYCNGVKLDNMLYYRYLGVIMSTSLPWTPAQEIDFMLHVSRVLEGLFTIELTHTHSHTAT